MPSAPFGSALKSGAALLKNLTTIKPKSARLTIGLDIGSTSVKAVALGAQRGKGTRPIIGHGLAPLGGPDGDVAGAVKTALALLKVPVSTVTMSVSGPWVLMRIIEIPKMRPTELRQALPFEAQRYLPFNIQDVVLDGAVLGPSDKNRVWVVIVACKKELLGRRVDGVKRAGVGVAIIDADALALANAFLEHEGGRAADGTRALVNIGAQLANLVILRGGVPYLVRDIPWGSEKLLRQVAEQTGKDNAAVSQELAQEAISPETLNALKLACEPLVTELQLSFDYFENRFNQPPEEVLLTGGLSLSAPFLEALKGQVAQAVMSWAPTTELTRQFTIAYGLALRDQ